MPASSPFRLRWPLLVLLASIGLTAFAAFDAQRAVRGQNEVVARAIHEFSSFAAWSYSEHLKGQLSLSASEVIGAVNHGGDMHTNPNVPDADDLAHYIPYDSACACHRTRHGPGPATFFAFKLGTTEVDVARNYFPGPGEGWRIDPVPGMPLPPSNLYPEAERRWIADTLNAHARVLPRDDFGYGLLLGRFDGRVRPIIYTLVSVHFRQHEIEQDQVEIGRVKRIVGMIQTVDPIDGMTIGDDLISGGRAQHQVVLDQQHPHRHLTLSMLVAP